MSFFLHHHILWTTEVNSYDTDTNQVPSFINALEMQSSEVAGLSFDNVPDLDEWVFTHVHDIAS